MASPSPVRLPSGHRRYKAAHVDQVARSIDDRQAGMSLEAAIARMRARRTRSSRRSSPGCAGAGRPCPCTCSPSGRCSPSAGRSRTSAAPGPRGRCSSASFQQRAVLPRERGAVARPGPHGRHGDGVRRLRRTTAGGPADRSGSGWRRTPRCSGSGRSCATAPDAAACVVGFERPAAAGEPRRFEAVWSVEPAVVHDAGELGVALAGRSTRRRCHRRPGRTSPPPCSGPPP